MKYLIVCILLSPIVAAGQYVGPPGYNSLIRQADSLYAVKQYKSSALLFSMAFAAWAGKGRVDDRYHAACAWSSAGMADSAFFNLGRITTRADFSDYTTLIMEGALVPLHHDSRWKPLLLQVRANKYKKYNALNMPLVYLIDSMIDEDQQWRSQWRWHNNHELPAADDSLSEEAIKRKMVNADSVHYSAVAAIFQQFGYPGYDVAGKESSDNYWALVQHQDAHPGFQDLVLEKMKAAVDIKNASGDKYAYLLDRTNFNKGLPQVYGTQMILNKDSTAYIPVPVGDPGTVNERRRAVGLNGTLDEYAAYYNKRFPAPKKR